MAGFQQIQIDRIAVLKNLNEKNMCLKFIGK